MTIGDHFVKYCVTFIFWTEFDKFKQNKKNFELQNIKEIQKLTFMENGEKCLQKKIKVAFWSEMKRNAKKSEPAPVKSPIMELQGLYPFILCMFNQVQLRYSNLGNRVDG